MHQAIRRPDSYVDEEAIASGQGERKRPQALGED